MSKVSAALVASVFLAVPLFIFLASCEEEPAKAPLPPPPPPTASAPAPAVDAGIASANSPPDFETLGRFPDSIGHFKEWLKTAGSLPPLPPPKLERTAAGAYQTTYALGYFQTVLMSYPTMATIPQQYWPYYPNVLDTIQHYTLQSLERDGFPDAQVTVTCPYYPYLGNVFIVSITSANAGTQGYATVHPKFVDPSHGWQSGAGAGACLACKDCSSCPALCETSSDGGVRPGACWDPLAPNDPAWSLFLPLGLPMLNQKTVLFLDYPPVDSMLQDAGAGHGDYLGNYTMCRWSRVLGAAGAVNPTSYETIVDSRPIAAGGSGMDSYLPVPQTTFNSAATGGLYINPMLQLLAASDASAPATLPVAVFGWTARQTWGQMAGDGGIPAVLAVGSTNILGGTTGWISTNHPDVTSYECCGSDTYCKPNSRYLVSDEQQDFVAACWMQDMGANPAASPQATKTTCSGQWMPPPAKNAQAECIQEKLDSNDPSAVCCTWADAFAYCSSHGNNACATNDCSVSEKAKAKAPKTPEGQQETCNEMRFFPPSPYCTRCGGCASSSR